MKKAEEWYKIYEYNSTMSIKSLIKQAQIDAIDATVKRCAKLGRIDEGQYHLIGEQLKKELE